MFFGFLLSDTSEYNHIFFHLYLQLNSVYYITKEKLKDSISINCKIKKKRKGKRNKSHLIYIWWYMYVHMVCVWNKDRENRSTSDTWNTSCAIQFQTVRNDGRKSINHGCTNVLQSSVAALFLYYVCRKWSALRSYKNKNIPLFAILLDIKCCGSWRFRFEGTEKIILLQVHFLFLCIYHVYDVWHWK